MSARAITDPGLPGLAGALDPERVRAELASALERAGDATDVHAVTVADVRYEPGFRAELLYRAKLGGPGAERRKPALIRGELLAGGIRPAPAPPDLVARYHALGCAPREPELWAPELGLALTAFPVDGALPTLFDALDPRAVARALGELWRGRAVVVREVRVDRLGYTPNARAAFAYELLLEQRPSGVPEVRRLIGKLHSAKPADRLFAGSWALWRGVAGRCRLAPPVGYLPGLGVALQEQLRGVRLGGLAGEPRFRDHARRTARALAALHGAAVPLATRRKPTDEARVLARGSAVLAAIRPDLAPRVARLKQRLLRALEGRVEMKGPVHGDFHHTNVLVDDDAIAIIDLDEMAWGDPLLDVGRFLASLRVPSLRVFGNVDGLASARADFLDTYLGVRPEDERRVRLHEAACLFTAAASAFRIQRAGWHEEVDLILAESERAWEQAREVEWVGPSRGADPGPFPVVADARRWATDPVYMKALLDAPLAARQGARPHALAVRTGPSHGPVRYRASGRRAGRGWRLELEAVELPAAGLAALRRLEVLRRALAEDPHAPALPYVALHVRALAMVVLEAPRGRSVAALLDTPAGLEGLTQLGRALAALHRAPAELDSVRPWSDELDQLARRVRRLSARDPGLHERATELLAEIARDRTAATTAQLEPVGPALGAIRLSDVFPCGPRIMLRGVPSPAMAPAAVDVADVLARLRLAAARASRPEGPHLRERFLAGYRELGGAPVAPPVEAAVLVRLACTQAEKGSDAGVPARLLRDAAALV